VICKNAPIIGSLWVVRSPQNASATHLSTPVELPVTKPSPASASVVPIIRATRRFAGLVHPVPITRTNLFGDLEPVIGYVAPGHKGRRLALSTLDLRF
jgi:hypothetical protein